jgi:hypothetical protein
MLCAFLLLLFTFCSKNLELTVYSRIQRVLSVCVRIFLLLKIKWIYLIMSNIDEDEIVKALSLEEAALKEFKRRKSSLPAPQNYTKHTNGK